MAGSNKLTIRKIAKLGPGDHSDGSGLVLRVFEGGADRRGVWRLVTYQAPPGGQGVSKRRGGDFGRRRVPCQRNRA